MTDVEVVLPASRPTLRVQLRKDVARRLRYPLAPDHSFSVAPELARAQIRLEHGRLTSFACNTSGSFPSATDEQEHRGAGADAPDADDLGAMSTNRYVPNRYPPSSSRLAEYVDPEVPHVLGLTLGVGLVERLAQRDEQRRHATKCSSP